MGTNFKIVARDKNSKARLGVLTTPHGKINTPSYVFVGTYGKIRNLSPKDIKSTKTQVIISNTFHLWDRALKNKKGDGFIHDSFGLKIPIMTDSGGFQVLSLAFGLDNRVGKFLKDDAKKTDSYKRQNVKILNDGVHFKYMGKEMFLGPKLSIQLQNKIGADILMAFDHITGPLDTYSYNKKAVENTYKWAKECLREHRRLQALQGRVGARNSDKNDERPGTGRRAKGEVPSQLLFGIVQGGIFKDLREKSAKQIGSLEFEGFGIGGSYTKKQIAQILKWIIPYLPEEKPRHLLGVGKIEDIFEAVENGIDTFDCVIPTREARHGRLYTKTGTIDIRQGKHNKDQIIERSCKCPVCSKKIFKSKIRSYFKNPKIDDKNRGQRLALIHNMWFFNNLLENIRDSIQKNRYQKFKTNFLSKFNK